MRVSRQATVYIYSVDVYYYCKMDAKTLEYFCQNWANLRTDLYQGLYRYNVQKKRLLRAQKADLITSVKYSVELFRPLKNCD